MSNNNNTKTSLDRILQEKPIDFDFLKIKGFIQDEDLYWKNNILNIEYDYYSEWMWFGKEGIPRIDSQKRFKECLDTNGDVQKLNNLNINYTNNF